MAESVDFFVVIPVKKQRTGMFKYRWAVCGRAEAAAFRVMRNTSKGRWELIDQLENASSAFSEAKRLSVMNRSRLVEAESLSQEDLAQLAAMVS